VSTFCGEPHRSSVELRGIVQLSERDNIRSYEWAAAVEVTKRMPGLEARLAELEERLEKIAKLAQSEEG
jgi:hypothetical protein